MTPATVMGADHTPAMEETQMGIHPNTPQPDGLTWPPGTILGYRVDGRPIHVIAGGAEGDDGPDIEVEVDDDPEPEPVEDPEPEPDDKPKPKPPAKKAEAKPADDDYVPTASEWKRTKEALAKSNADAKRNRERARELEEQTRANETEHEKALREAREEGEKRFREPMKKSGVRAALAEAGFSAPERLMKLVDWDAITVDDDGALIGAEAEVDRVKSEYPELLPQDKAKPKARPTGAPKPAAVEKPKSTAEIHAARLLGRA
jgi:DNA polymerase III gamma/tau subunit